MRPLAASLWRSGATLGHAPSAWSSHMARRLRPGQSLTTHLPRHRMASAATSPASLFGSPALRLVRWQILSRVGMLVGSYGVCRALEQHRRLHSTHAQMALAGQWAGTEAEAGVCPEELHHAIDTATEPGDLLELLSLGDWCSLDGSHVASVLQRLAAMCGNNDGLRAAVLAHPAVTHVVNTAHPAMFPTLKSLAGYVDACGQLGRSPSHIEDLVMLGSSYVQAGDYGTDALLDWARALGVSTVAGHDANSVVHDALERRLHAFTPEELAAVACSPGVRPSVLAKIADEVVRLSHKGADMDAARVVVMVDALLPNLTGASSRHLLHGISQLLLRYPVALAGMSDGSVVALLSAYASAQHRSPRVLCCLVREVSRRRPTLIAEQLSDVYKALGSMHRLLAADSSRTYATVHLVSCMRKLAPALLTDIRDNIHAYPAHALVNAAWWLSNAEVWDAEVFARIASRCGKHVRALSPKELAMFSASLATSHTHGNVPLERDLLCHVRSAAYDKAHRTRFPREALKTISLALNSVGVKSINKDVAWAGRTSREEWEEWAAQAGRASNTTVVGSQHARDNGMRLQGGVRERPVLWHRASHARLVDPWPLHSHAVAMVA